MQSPIANLQLVYVSDIDRSRQFYTTLFNTDPIYTGTRYVAFAVNNDTRFAIWANGSNPDVTITRFNEIGIMLPGNHDVDALYEQWKENPAITIIQKPVTEVFGRTFLVKDPDGHIIRVCPKD